MTTILVRLVHRARIACLALAVTLAVATAAAPAAAQQAVPSRLQAVTAVDLRENFDRVQRYNLHVQAANQARLARAQSRTRAALHGLGTVALIGVGAWGYTEYSRQLDIGDGSGGEVAAMAFAGSIGGIIWTGLNWRAASSAAKEYAASERAQVNAARALLPTVDPLRTGGR